MRARPGHLRTAKLLRAAFFTCAGYSCLTLYDALAVRFAGARVPYPRVALISFMGYAIGHNVGFNTLSGGAVRYRAYTALGLAPSRSPPSSPSARSPFAWARAAARRIAAVAGRHVGIGAACARLARRARRRLAACGGGRLFVAGLHAPRAAAFAQARDSRAETAQSPSRRSASAAPICCARRACCTCCCRAQAAIGFWRSPASISCASPRASISNVPGGIGVFEIVLLLLMPGGAQGPAAGRAGRLSRHLLFRAVCRRAGACWARMRSGCIARRSCDWRGWRAPS